MNRRGTWIAMLAATTVLAVSGCSPEPTNAHRPIAMNWQSVVEIQQAAAASSKHEAAAIEVTRNQYHIVVSITGPDGDTAAVADMEAESAMIVGAVEKKLAGMRELDAIQGISVAFVHQHAGSARHTDDVFEFRKGPSGSFQLHTT